MSLFGADKIRGDGFGVRLGVHDGSQSLWERQKCSGCFECGEYPIPIHNNFLNYMGCFGLVVGSYLDFIARLVSLVQ